MTTWKRNLSVLWVTQVLSLSGFYFVTPFLPFYIQELQPLSPDQVKLWTGLIASATAAAMGVAAPIWGTIADRFGYKIMILRAMAAGSLILFLMTRIDSVAGVLVLRIAQGLLTGTVTAATTLVAMGTPNERAASALGTLSSSTFVGFSLGPFFGGYAAELMGYRSSFSIGSLLLATGFFLVLFFVIEPSAGVGHGPEGPAGSISSRGVSEYSHFESDNGLWRLIAPYLLMIFLLRIVRMMAIPFIPLYVQETRGELGGVAGIVGLIQGMIGLAGAVAGVTLARIGDRMPRASLVSFCAGIALIALVPVSFVKTMVLFTVLYVFVSFFLGGIEPNLQSEISRLIPPNRRGFVFGILTTVGSAGRAIAPVTGSFVSIRFGISSVFTAISIVLAMVFVAAMIVRWNQKRRAR